MREINVREKKENKEFSKIKQERRKQANKKRNLMEQKKLSMSVSESDGVVAAAAGQVLSQIHFHKFGLFQ